MLLQVVREIGILYAFRNVVRHVAGCDMSGITDEPIRARPHRSRSSRYYANANVYVSKMPVSRRPVGKKGMQQVVRLLR